MRSVPGGTLRFCIAQLAYHRLPWNGAGARCEMRRALALRALLLLVQIGRHMLQTLHRSTRRGAMLGRRRSTEL